MKQIAYKVVKVIDGKLYSCNVPVPVRVEYKEGEVVTAELGPLMCFDERRHAELFLENLIYEDVSAGADFAYALYEAEIERWTNTKACYRIATVSTLTREAVKSFWEDPREYPVEDRALLIICTVLASSTILQKRLDFREYIQERDGAYAI